MNHTEILKLKHRQFEKINGILIFDPESQNSVDGIYRTSIQGREESRE